MAALAGAPHGFSATPRGCDRCDSRDTLISGMTARVGDDAAFLGVERSAGGRRWRLRGAAADGAAAEMATHLRCPRSSRGCWRSAASGSSRRPGFSAPRLRDQLPDPAHLRDMDARRRAARARHPRRREDRRLRRLRCRRRDLGGAAAAVLRGGRRARRGLCPRPACAKATGPTPRRCCKPASEEGAGRRRHASIAAPPRIDAAGRRRGWPGSTSSSSTITSPSRCCRARSRWSTRTGSTRASPHGDLAAVGVAFLLVVAANRALRDAGWYAQPARARPLAMARPRGARHGVRRGAAHRPQPRAGGAGAEGRCSAAPTPAWRRWPRSRGIGRRAARRLSSRLCAGAAGQCRRPGRRRRSRRAPAVDRRSGAGRRAGAASRRLQPRAPRDRGAHLGRGDRGGRAARSAIAASGLRRGARAGIPASSASSRRGSRSATSARPASSRSPTASARARAARSPGCALGPAVIAARQAGLLLNGGGHAMAAGFTVAADRLRRAARTSSPQRLGDGLGRRARWSPSWRSTRRSPPPRRRAS